MNIVLLFLLCAVCGSLLVAIPFLLKYFIDISKSLLCISYYLDKLSQDYDSHMWQLRISLDKLSNKYLFEEEYEEEE